MTTKQQAALVSAATPGDAERALAALRSLQADPVFFCTHFLGYEPWAMQRKVLAALAEPQVRVAVKAAHSVGKCCRASDRATLADGSEVAWGDLVGRSFPLLTVSDNQLVAVAARAAWNRVEPVHRLTTETGFVADRNAAHPFWAIDDAHPERGPAWTPLEKLTAAMRIAVPASLPVFGDAVVEDATARLLGWASAAWATIGATTGLFPRAAFANAAQAEEVADLCRALGGEWREERQAAWVDAGLGGAQTRSGWRVSRCQALPNEPDRFAGRPVEALLAHHGLLGPASGRRAPALAFRLPRRQLALYLSRLCANARVAPGQLAVRLPSAGLAADAQRLLLRLGVRATRRRKVDLLVTDPRSRRAFAAEIGLPHRGDELAPLLADLAPEPEASEPLVWERVLSVRPLGRERTVAVEVPGHETYLTPTAFEHNTNLAAMAALWMTGTGGITITTAPTWQQVVRLLWKEIHATYARYKHILGGEMLTSEWRLSPTNFALGLSTNEGTRFQGIHADRVLVIFDEGPGVKPDIWEAAEGIRAGGDVRFLALGNPTAVGNPFHAAFQSAGESTGWRTFSIPAFITPNFAKWPTIEALLAADPAEFRDLPKPYLTTPRWVLEKYREWGPDSPMYRSRVLAEFPTQSEDSLISMVWIGEAQGREFPLGGEDIIVGIDVAGPGEDETALVARQGGQIIEERGWVKPDPRLEAITVLASLRDRAADQKVRLRVYVDAIAIGHYFALDLKSAGFDVTPVNVGLPAVGGEAMKGRQRLTFLRPAQKEEPRDKYVNLKAQLSWLMREAFQFGSIGGQMSDLLQGQLAVLRYFQTDKGKLQMESKDALKARGNKSPDRAEALMLTFYDGAPTAEQRTYRPSLLMDEVTGWGPDDPFGLVERGRVLVV